MGSDAAVMRRPVISNKLLWAGVLGGGLAWSAQLVVGYGLEEIACSPGTSGSDIFGISVSTLIYAMSSLAAVVTLGAIALCAVAIRRARTSDQHRNERIVFMGITGVAANLLFLAVIGYGAIAPLFLGSCR